MLNLALFGATGTIGRRILTEALGRGHRVTVIARRPLDLEHPALRVVTGDVTDPTAVARIVGGHDAIVSAIGPPPGAPPAIVVDAARSLLAVAREAGVRRLLAVGGAGGLEVAPGIRLVDTPTFPAAWKGIALAHIDAYEVYRQADLDWTFVAPAAHIAPGARTGHYRTATDQLLTDEQGGSHISTEDYAVAVLDELERPHFLRSRLAVAY